MQAVAKFWKTPELLGEFFSFLDLKSALSLARVLDKDVLKRSLSSKVWRRLVKRSFDGVGILDWTELDPETDDETLDETLDVARKLSTMLKIANSPQTLLMDTLNLILQKHPPTRRWSPYSDAFYSSSSLDNLQLASSPNSESCAVSKWGFIILEEFEGTLGTAELHIRSIELGFDPRDTYSYVSSRLLTAIGSRLARQNEKATSIRINSNIYIEEGRKGAQSLYTILQVNPAMLKAVKVSATGLEDWEWVAKAMKLQPGAVREVTFIKARLPDPRTRSSKEVRRCIREIWDAVGPTGFRIYPKRFEGPMTYHCNVCLIKTRSSTACHVGPLALKRLIHFASIIWVYPFKHI